MIRSKLKFYGKILSVLFLFTCHFSPHVSNANEFKVSKIVSTNDGIEIILDNQANIEIESTPMGDKLSLQGCGRDGEHRSPELPFFPIKLLLPEDIEKQNMLVQIGDQQWEDIEGEFDIRPNVISVNSEIEHSKDYMNEDVYSSNVFIPKTVIGSINISKYRIWNIGDISIKPVQYNPYSGKIKLLRKATITISYLSSLKIGGNTQEHNNWQHFWDKIERHVMNPQALSIYYENLTGKSDGLEKFKIDKAGSIPENPNYIIITRQAIVDLSNDHSAGSTISDFIEHKQSLGFNVRTITEGEADDYHYGDTVEFNSIRTWLIDRYATWGIDYILIIGGKEFWYLNSDNKVVWVNIPALEVGPYEDTNNWTVDSFLSDYYYGELNTEDLDSNNNGKFCEFEEMKDDIDHYPEVSVGRIFVSNSTDSGESKFNLAIQDLNFILDNIIEYEISSFWNTNDDIGLIAAAITNDQTAGDEAGENIKNLLESKSFSTTTMYEQDSECFQPSNNPDFDLNKTNFFDQLTNQHPIITYIAGHGNSHSVGRRKYSKKDNSCDSENYSDVDWISTDDFSTNTTEHAGVYAITSCQTGSEDVCLAKK